MKEKVYINYCFRINKLGNYTEMKKCLKLSLLGTIVCSVLTVVQTGASEELGQQEIKQYVAPVYRELRYGHEVIASGPFHYMMGTSEHIFGEFDLDFRSLLFSTDAAFQIKNMSQDRHTVGGFCFDFGLQSTPTVTCSVFGGSITLEPNSFCYIFASHQAAAPYTVIRSVTIDGVPHRVLDIGTNQRLPMSHVFNKLKLFDATATREGIPGVSHGQIVFDLQDYAANIYLPK